jgi:hypothetical protein
MGAAFASEPPAAAAYAPVAYPQPIVKRSSGPKIALWTAGSLLLLIIAGIGSCTYVLAHRVKGKLEEARRRIEESSRARGAAPGGAIFSGDPCTLITKEELSEIYNRPFSFQVREGNTCRFRPSEQATYGVRLSIYPDALKFDQAARHFHARISREYGPRSFHAGDTLYLTYSGNFLQIATFGGSVATGKIVRKILPRLQSPGLQP